MKVFLTLAVILHVSLGSHVSVRLPYQNPAGVTYLNGYYQGHEFPAASSLSSSSSSSLSSSSPIAYSAPGQLHYQHQGIQYQQGFQYQQPLHQYQQASQYQQAYRYAAAPIYPAKIESHHVGYAAAQVPAIAAVPYVKHVPTVSHIPVTRYEAQPAVIEKQLDIAKPAVSTRKFEVRRPAIQKQFYDIEERVIIRPAGSAVVELDEPTSKLQRGPEVVQSLEANTYAAQSQSPHKIVAQAFSFGQGPSSQNAVPIIAHAPVHVTIAPVISHAPVSHIQSSPSTPAPVAADSSESQQSESQSSDEEVVVDNADFRSAQFSSASLNSRSFGQGENSAAKNQQQQQQQEQQQQQRQQQQQQQFFQRSSQEANSRQASPAPSTPNSEARSNGVALNSPSPKFIAHDYNPSNSQVIPSVRNSPEENQSNQQRLIDLLTARGGVTEVGFGRDGETSGSVSEAGHVRARVISATPAPEYADATGERVSTRRVVVSRPIETLQEVDVVEPATKYERVSVQQPTYIKTAHLDHVQVHGSIPVVGKAFAPAIAHAAVPVYQKTISPAYAY